MATITEQLYLLCEDYVRSREEAIKKTLTEVREAANNETKSSAGDKYETGREVMQQEINLNQMRLSELNKLRTVLEHIAPTDNGDSVLPGSAVYTNNGNFYVAISAGLLQVADTKYYAVSAASPMGIKLLGKKARDSFELNGKRFVIEKVG